MFNIFLNDWPSIEKALVAFSHENYIDPVVIYYTPGGFIEQDMTDGCFDVHSLSSEEPPPIYGLWVWEGTFQVLDDIYDSIEGVGKWRLPSSNEWTTIIKQQNPWEEIHEH